MPDHLRQCEERMQLLAMQQLFSLIGQPMTDMLSRGVRGQGQNPFSITGKGN